MSGINTTGAWLKNQKKPRDGEVIGAGFFVFRRGGGTGRIRPAQWPFEHPNLEAAEAEAAKLAAKMPGYTFDVLQVVSSEIRLIESEAAE